jgi:hypothetical protein
MHPRLSQEALQMRDVKSLILQGADALAHAAQALPRIGGQAMDLIAELLMSMTMIVGQAAGSGPTARCSSSAKALALNKTVAAHQPEREALDRGREVVAKRMPNPQAKFHDVADTELIS